MSLVSKGNVVSDSEMKKYRKEKQKELGHLQEALDLLKEKHKKVLRCTWVLEY